MDDAEPSTCSATGFGAVGDGSTDDAPAIQRALNAGRSRVWIPFGVYRIGRTLRIRSGTRLEIHPEARLIMCDGAGVDAGCFLLTNADHERGDEAIEVRGGVWDGNNPGNPRVEPLVQAGAYTGRMIHFDNVRGLVFADAMLCDAESYYLSLTRARDFLIERLRFHTRRPRPNNDGVHLGGFCEDGVIRHLRGLGPAAPNDDMVALNADDALQRVEVQGLRCGPIRRIAISDLQADQCHTFVRMLSTVSPIERVMVDRVRGGCDVCALNMDGARNCRVQVFDAGDPRFANGVGDVRDVRISDLRVHKTRRNGAPLLRLEQRIRGLVIERLERDEHRDAAPDAPTLAARHLPGHRIELQGLTEAQWHSIASAPGSGWRTGVAAADNASFGHEVIAELTTPTATAVLPAGSIPRLVAGRVRARQPG